MQDLEKFNALVTQSHESARAGGWWSDLETGEPIDRNKGELLALVHTELAEARRGIGGMDDKLPHRKGEEVELADVVIRLGDYAGGFDYDVRLDPNNSFRTFADTEEAKTAYVLFHELCAEITEHERKGRHSSAAERLQRLLRFLFAFANSRGHDLVGAIEEKLAFNAQRADHKIENRAAKGGKKF